MKMKNTTYDILNFLAAIIIPGLGVLYFTLSEIWGLPFGEEILATSTAVDTLLGAILKYLSAKYHKENAIDEGVEV